METLAFSSSALGKLPRELIVHIARFLPLASAASFTISSRPVKTILGTSYLDALHGDPIAQYEFINLLDLTGPNHIACLNCRKFHAISHHTQPACTMTTPEIHDRFTSTVFQMAMKRYRQGGAYGKFLRLLSRETRTQPPWARTSLRQETFLARIRAGCLLMRAQVVFVFRGGERRGLFRVCPHLTCLIRPRGIFEGHTVSERGLYLCCQLSDGLLRQCSYCSMEYQFDLAEMEKGFLGVFITRWQNLGEGRSSLDGQWRSHLSDSRGDYPVGESGVSWTPVSPFEPGSIRSAFERGQTYGIEGLLTTENKRKLLVGWKDVAADKIK